MKESSSYGYICSIRVSNLLLGELQMVGAVLLFGLSFVGQKLAMDDGLGPFTFNGTRFAISCIIISCLKPYLEDKSDTEADDQTADIFNNETCSFSSLSSQEGEVVQQPKNSNSPYFNQSIFKLIYWGFIVGFSHFLGSTLQQVGLVTVSAGKAGFITGAYVVILPFAEWAIPGFGKHLNTSTVFAAITSMAGLYLLSGCANPGVEQCFGNKIGFGEILLILSTFAWVLSILSLDVAVKNCNVFSLTFLEFLVPTMLSLAVAVALEPLDWIYPYDSLLRNWKMILLVGFTDSGAFLLAAMGQRHVPPSRTGLILSLESVSAAVCGYLFLNELLSYPELFGCLLMLTATSVSSYYHNYNPEIQSETAGQAMLFDSPNSTNSSKSYPDIEAQPNHYNYQKLNMFQQDDRQTAVTTITAVPLSPTVTPVASFASVTPVMSVTIKRSVVAGATSSLLLSSPIHPSYNGC